MSITTEISRITKAKEDIRTSLVNKGATISETAKLDEYSAIIDEMTIGSGGTITDSDGLVFETEKYSGGPLAAIVTSVSFPKTGITSLSGACNGMTNLRTVKRFPNDVSNMSGAFNGCTSLVSIPTIPDSVEYMPNAFFDCASLTGITNFPSNIILLGNAFNGCTSLVSIPTIPDSVTDMPNAFKGCTSLTSIPNIPTGVTSLYNTFNGCTSLKKVPEIRSNTNKKSIVSYNIKGTFKGCSLLEEVILNTHTMLDINSETFSGCPSTLKIYVNEGMVNDFKNDSYTKNFTILPIEKRWYEYYGGGACVKNIIYGVRVKEFNSSGNYYNKTTFKTKSNNEIYLVYNTTEKRFETYTVINGVTSETTVLQPDENGYYKIMFDEPVKTYNNSFPVELFI